MVLKSPVRENRPPGSARGRRGNPPFYLNNFHKFFLGVLRVSVASAVVILTQNGIPRLYERHSAAMEEPEKVSNKSNFAKAYEAYENIE